MMQYSLLPLDSLMAIVSIIVAAFAVIIIVMAKSKIVRVTFWSGTSEVDLKGVEYENKVVCQRKPETFVFIKDQSLKAKIRSQGLQTVHQYYASETNCRLFDPQDYNNDKEIQKLETLEEWYQVRAAKWIADNKVDFLKLYAKGNRVDWNNPVHAGIIVDMGRMVGDRRGMKCAMPSEIGQHEDSGLRGAIRNFITSTWSWASFVAGGGIIGMIVMICYTVGWL